MSLSFVSGVAVIFCLVPSYKDLQQWGLDSMATAQKESLILHDDVGSRLANHDAADFESESMGKDPKKLRLTVLFDSSKLDDTKELRSDEL